jgi:hypothetical protein
MKTSMLMIASALFMAVLGLGASFLPREILSAWGARPEASGVLTLQITGALYLGFASLNWAARGNVIGGIYSRPVALGNFLHFAVVSIVLGKALIAGQNVPLLIVAATIYAAFAVWFGYILFTHPASAVGSGRGKPDNVS